MKNGSIKSSSQKSTNKNEKKKNNDSLSIVSHVYLNYFNLANLHYYYKNYNIHKDHGVEPVETRQNCKKKKKTTLQVSELPFGFF